MRPWPTGGAAAPKTKKYTYRYILTHLYIFTSITVHQFTFLVKASERNAPYISDGISYMKTKYTSDTIDGIYILH